MLSDPSFLEINEHNILYTNAMFLWEYSKTHYNFTINKF